MRAFLIPILFLSGCTSVITPNQAHKWTEDYGANFALTMVGNGFTFPFPNAPGHVNYITKDSGPLKIGQTITVTYRIDGNAKFATTQKDTGQPAFRPMILLDMYSAHGRYWSSAYVDLKPIGQTTFTVTINPDQWTDVYGAKGSQYPDEFKRALSGGSVGITFGGTTGGYGHGAQATGKSTFTLTDFTVR